MKALQYIYTSWKNGDSADKGFMVWSKSQGVTDAESDMIVAAMKYTVPKDMDPAPTPEQIAESYPFSFSYFRLPNGRDCVAQTTYLGEDYSGRAGNYIISALLFNQGELTVRPYELFGEGCLRTSLSEEELNAASPVPPLPVLEIDSWGSRVNDGTIRDFLAIRTDDFASLLSALISAGDGGQQIFLNDTRENLVLWFAALQRAFPLQTVGKITFNTYVGDCKKFDYASCRIKPALCGVLSGENGFDYAADADTAGKIVFDFIGWNRTSGFVPGNFEKMISETLAEDPAGLDEWLAFLGKIGLRELNRKLYAAYDAFRLLHGDDLGLDEKKADTLLSFCSDFGDESFRADVCGAILHNLRGTENFSPDSAARLFSYLYKHAGFMQTSVHDQFLRYFTASLEKDPDNSGRTLSETAGKVRKNASGGFNSFLSYILSDKKRVSLADWLMEHKELSQNQFWLDFLLGSYKNNDGIRSDPSKAELAEVILHNLAADPGEAETVLKQLVPYSDSWNAIYDVVSMYFSHFTEDQIRSTGPAFGSFLNKIGKNSALKILSGMMNDPDLEREAVFFDSMYIGKSDQPDDAFWNLYKTQFSKNARLDHVDLSPMIMAFLQKQNKAEDAAEMIEKLPVTNIGSSAAVAALADSIETLPVKKIRNLRGAVPAKLIGLLKNYNLTGRAPKTEALLFLESLENNGAPMGLTEAMRSVPLRLEEYDKKDYQELTSLFFPVMISSVTGKEDLRTLCRIFRHPKYFDTFTGMLTDEMKRNEKKNKTLWERLNIAACSYLIDCRDQDEDAEALYKEYAKYFRRLDESETARIRKAALQLCSVPDTDFFEKIRETEGAGSFFSNLFKKKK